MVGRMRRATGVVPRRTPTGSRWSMPHMTEVGQSGPPTRIDTLATDMGLDSTIFMARTCEKKGFTEVIYETAVKTRAINDHVVTSLAADSGGKNVNAVFSLRGRS